MGINHSTTAGAIKVRTFKVQVCVICNYAAFYESLTSPFESFLPDNLGKAFRNPYAFSRSKCGEQYS
jgi:hypothetical protein